MHQEEEKKKSAGVADSEENIDGLGESSRLNPRATSKKKAPISPAMVGFATKNRIRGKGRVSPKTKAQGKQVGIGPNPISNQPLSVLRHEDPTSFETKKGCNRL